MSRDKKLAKIRCAGVVLAIILLSMAMASYPTSASAADEKMEADQLVEKARMTFDNMVADSNLEALVDLLKRPGESLSVPRF